MKRILACLLLFAMLLLQGCTDSKAPTAPENATAAENGKKITLGWTAAKNAEFYRIYRLSPTSADYKFVDDVNELLYTDTTAERGVEYRYKITAVRGSAESEGAITETVILPAPETVSKDALSVPVITSVTKMDVYTNAVMFSAGNTSSKNSDCVYEILRSTAIDGTYESIGKTDETVWYDENANGRDFYYRVAAERGSEKTELSIPQKTGKNARSVFRVPVLMYHEFVTQSDLDQGVAFDEYAIWAGEFEEDLRWIRANGYTPITCRKLVEYMEGTDTDIPSKPILLTADDGKYGVYKNAYPLLKKYGMTMSLSLIGYEIDGATNHPESRNKSAAPYCTWSEIAEMADSGVIEIVSHTQRLHVFEHNGRTGANCMDGESLESYLPVAQSDFASFNKNLKTHNLEPVVAMAYPYSKRSPTADRAWLKSGYKILLGGDDDSERKTKMNYFVQGAGINSKSAVLRRMARMVNVPAKTYVEEAVRYDGN